MGLKAYVQKQYNADYRRALDWMHTTQRFGDQPELIANLPEATIRRLVKPSLAKEDALQIVAAIHSGEIKSDYRSVDEAIGNIKEAKRTAEAAQVTIQRNDEVKKTVEQPPLSSLAIFDQEWLKVLEAGKIKMEMKKIKMERELSDLLKDKENLQRKLANIDEQEKQMRLAINIMSDQLNKIQEMLSLPQ